MCATLREHQSAATLLSWQLRHSIAETPLLCQASCSIRLSVASLCGYVFVPMCYLLGQTCTHPACWLVPTLAARPRIISFSHIPGWLLSWRTEKKALLRISGQQHSCNETLKSRRGQLRQPGQCWTWTQAMAAADTVVTSVPDLHDSFAWKVIFCGAWLGQKMLKS